MTVHGETEAQQRRVREGRARAPPGRVVKRNSVSPNTRATAFLHATLTPSHFGVPGSHSICNLILKKKKKSTEYSINIKFLFHNFQTHRGTLEEKKKKMTTTTKKKPGFDFFWKTAHRSEFNLGLSEILTGHIMVSVFLQ